MKMRFIGANVVIMVLVGGLGLTRYSEGVRTVKVIGLFGSGMAVGAAFISVVNELRAKTKKI